MEGKGHLFYEVESYKRPHEPRTEQLSSFAVNHRNNESRSEKQENFRSQETLSFRERMFRQTIQKVRNASQSSMSMKSAMQYPLREDSGFPDDSHSLRLNKRRSDKKASKQKCEQLQQLVKNKYAQIQPNEPKQLHQLHPSFLLRTGDRRSKRRIKFGLDLDLKSKKNNLDSSFACSARSLNSSTDSSFDPEILQECNGPNLNSKYIRHATKEKIKIRDLNQYEKCVIMPDDPWKLRWNVFLIIIVGIASVVTPVRVAWYDDSQVFWIVGEIFIDFIFFLDIIFSFLSAFYNRVEVLIHSRRQIATNYIKTWFFIDLIAVLPFGFFANSMINQIGKVMRLPRVFKLIKSTKLMRTTSKIKQKPSLQKQVTQSLSSKSVEGERLLSLGVTFLILCHNLACFWFLLARLQHFNQQTWVTRYGYDFTSRYEQYMASLYFIVATITTVGYGDISSATWPEQAFSVVLMVIGVIAYSLTISAVSTIMGASDKRQAALRSELDVLARIRDQYSLSFELYWRLRQSLHYDHSTDRSEQQALIARLPGNLRVELSNIMYARELQDIEFFQHKSKSAQFTSEAAPLLKPVRVCQGEYVFEKGDAIDGIYFIRQGKAAYVQKRPFGDLVYATCLAGQYFGDIDFLEKEEKQQRSFSVKAVTDLDLYLLSKNDLCRLDADFRHEIFQLFEHSVWNLEKMKKMVRKGEKWVQRFGDPQRGDPPPQKAALFRKQTLFERALVRDKTAFGERKETIAREDHSRPIFTDTEEEQKQEEQAEKESGGGGGTSSQEEKDCIREVEQELEDSLFTQISPERNRGDERQESGGVVVDMDVADRKRRVVGAVGQGGMY